MPQRNRTIKHLDLGYNKIAILPYGFVHLQLQSLRLYRNDSLKFPLKSIADSESGSDDILAFFKDLQKGSVKVVHGKFMLIGHGMAGKSTLAKALNLSPKALGNLLRELQYKAGWSSFYYFVCLLPTNAYADCNVSVICRYEYMEHG